MNRIGVLSGLVLLAITASPVAASTINMTFDTSPTLGASQAPGVWYTDRYAPSGFASEFFLGDNRLKLTLSASDGASGRPGAYVSSFYDTQGRKYDVDSGSAFASIDMYIDASFEGAGRIGGIWATGVDSSAAVSAFPILEFANNQFRGWDNSTGWVSLGLPTGFAYDSFYTLSIMLDIITDTFTYAVNGETLGTVDAFGTQSLANVILQGINTPTGIDRSIYFDNLNVAPVPIPAALPLLAAALAGGVGFARFRRRRSDQAVPQAT